MTTTPPTDQLTSSNRLVPGRQLLTPTSTPPTNSPLGHNSKLSPRIMASSSPDTALLHSSKPMVRARSHSDQQSARDTSSLSMTSTTQGLLKVESSHHHLQKNNKHYHHRPAPSVPIAHMSNSSITTMNIGEDRGLKPNMNGLPLARRVRSATTLRQSEEDRVPLKALVANKQQQLYQASRYNNMNHSSDGIDNNNNQAKTKSKITKYTTDHRRSISADSTPNNNVINNNTTTSNNNPEGKRNIHVPPLTSLSSAKIPDWHTSRHSHTTHLSNNEKATSSIDDEENGYRMIAPLQLDGIKSDQGLQHTLNQALEDLDYWLGQVDISLSSL
ncbi:hypothetical protein BDC45DRAFT_523987 [Circinella umbellata]|nr:hypothetical protein BDC45DRAFT_523987 [Circinella umbellata]